MHLYLTDTFFCGATGGTFVEVGGAGRGTPGASATAGLEADMGWRGVLVEGSTSAFWALRAARPNATVVQAVVCAGDSEPVTFVDVGGGVGGGGIVQLMNPYYTKTWHPAVAAGNDTGPGTRACVACTPLGHVLAALGVTHANLLVLDVASAELSVIESLRESESTHGSATFDVIAVGSDEAAGGGLDSDPAVVDELAAAGYTLHSRHLRMLWFVRQGFQPVTCKQPSGPAPVAPRVPHQAPGGRGDTLALFTVGRGEQWYMVEWVTYHLHIGVDAIYIYDNEDVPTYHLLFPHEPRVTVIHMGMQFVQPVAMAHFKTWYADLHTWGCHIDVDEVWC
jgi:hypothetical protein